MNVVLRKTLVLAAAVLLAGLAACGGRHSAAPDSGTPGAGPISVASLGEALERIRAEEAGGSHAVKAMPDSVNADEAWLAGPTGNFTPDSGAHTMQLAATGTSPDDPSYICFAVYRLQNHTGDPIGHLDIDVQLVGTEYQVYVVDYSGTPQWHAFPPYTTNGSQTIDLASLSPVAPSGNVYVAIVADNNTSALISGTVGISPPAANYYEIENNDDYTQATVLPAFPFLDNTVDGSLGPGGGNYDGDRDDYFQFTVNGPGRVFLALTGFHQSNADLDLYLYDIDGTSEIGGSGSSDSTGTKDGEVVIEDLPAAGTYFVRIYQFSSGAQYSDYVLWGDFWPQGSTSFFETEPNDASGSANTFPAMPFPAGQLIAGSLGSGGSNYDGGNDDWYTFTLASQKIVQIGMFKPEQDGNTTIELLQSDGTTVIGSDNQTGVNPNYLSVGALLPAGTYYFHASVATGYHDYVLRASSIDQNPAQYYETEDNDDFSQADILPAFPFSGVAVTGSAGQGGGYYDGDGDDWFQFSLSSPKAISLTVRVVEGSGTATVDLVDTDGSTVLKSATSSPYSVNDFLAAGTYYLHINCSAGGFDYAVDGAAPTYYETEDNDTAATANVLPALPFTNTNITGDVGPDGAYDSDDDDWFKFTLGGAQGVELILSPISGAAAPTFELYDTDGVTLLDKHNSGTDYYIGESLASGTYYVHVSATYGYLDYYLQGYLRAPSGSFFEVEDNDSPASGNDLGAMPFSGLSASLGDASSYLDCDHIDWYKVTVASAGTITIDMAFGADTSKNDIDMALYDTDGTTLLKSSTGITNSEQIVQDLLAGGTYYLKVYVYKGGSDYTLDGSFI